MGRELSIGALTLLHVAMGAGFGALSCAGFVMLEYLGFRSMFGSLAETTTLIIVFFGLVSWMAVGAGLSGFIFINVERAR
jgi:hypothetical protein